MAGKYFSSHRILGGKPRWYSLAHTPSATVQTLISSIER
jgi:hypothetical protein